MKKVFYSVLLIIGYLLISLELQAQTLFLQPITNPFNLSDIGWRSSPAFVDIDNDGDFDLFAGASSGNFVFFENVGTATNPNFDTPLTNPFNLQNIGIYSSPTFGDLDGDGDFDMLAANQSSGEYLYFENIGTNTLANFQVPIVNPFGLTSSGSSKIRPKIVDYNGDSLLDIAVGTYSGNIYYFENIGTSQNPTFATVEVNPNGIGDIGTYSAPAFSDWDHDGDLDLAIGKNDGNCRNYLNTGSAISPSYVNTGDNQLGITNVGTYAGPEFVDIDNDGDEDLFIGNDSGNFIFQEYGASYSSLTDTACESYVSPSGNYTWLTSGTYFDTIANVVGCDSLIALYLTISNVDTTVTITSITLTANAVNGSYQWLDCNNNYTAINGEISQAFTPSFNGSYAVEVTQNGCTDISECITVNSVNISEEYPIDEIVMFPNPTSNVVYFNRIIDEVTIYDVSGQLKLIVDNTQNVNLASFKPGVYLVNSKVNDIIQITKLLIQ